MVNAWFRQAGVAVLAGLLLLVAACDDGDNTNGGASNSSGEDYPVTVMRSDGVELVVEEPPQRIVSLSPGATEIIYAIDAEDALAAVDHFSDYPQAAADFPTKLDAYEPNVEAIAGVEPDLVVVASDPGGLVEALDRLDIPVLFLDLDTDARTIDDVLRHIRIFGDITGHRFEASIVIGAMERRLAAVEEAIGDVDDAEAPSVYHELDETFYTVSEDTFIGDLYLRLGARNIAGDGGGTAYPQLTQEAIIAADPDVIILADEAFGVTVESVKARPGWSAITAVQEDRIYGIDPDIISRPGPRIVDALEELARRLYPERFA